MQKHASVLPTCRGLHKRRLLTSPNLPLCSSILIIQSLDAGNQYELFKLGENEKAYPRGRVGETDCCLGTPIAKRWWTFQKLRVARRSPTSKALNHTVGAVWESIQVCECDCSFGSTVYESQALGHRSAGHITRRKPRIAASLAILASSRHATLTDYTEGLKVCPNSVCNMDNAG